MNLLLKYIIVLSVIMAAVFLLSRDGFSLLPEKDETVVPQENNMTQPQTTRADISTNFGVIVIELFPDAAPKTVENFIKLAESGFYNGTKFHRVIKDFIIQGGDPNSKDDDWADDGKGGPGYTFEDEFNEHKVVHGALAMANTAKPNTNGSQFFIVTAQAAPWLDGVHTVFGRVVGGMEVIDKIESVATNEQNHPLEDVVVERITMVK